MEREEKLRVAAKEIEDDLDAVWQKTTQMPFRERFAQTKSSVTKWVSASPEEKKTWGLNEDHMWVLNLLADEQFRPITINSDEHIELKFINKLIKQELQRQAHPNGEEEEIPEPDDELVVQKKARAARVSAASKK